MAAELPPLAGNGAVRELASLEDVGNIRGEATHRLRPLPASPPHAVQRSAGQFRTVRTSVKDPRHFGVDPDPRIHAFDKWIRVQIRIRMRIPLCLSLTFKMSTTTKSFKKFFSILLYEGTFTSFFKGKK
jgi:hypothetical protein